jgi:hypothetical protein
VHGHPRPSGRYGFLFAQEAFGRPNAHRHGEHQVIVFGKPPPFELLFGSLGLEVRKLLRKRPRQIEPLGYLELLLLEEEEC